MEVIAADRAVNAKLPGGYGDYPVVPHTNRHDAAQLIGKWGERGKGQGKPLMGATLLLYRRPPPHVTRPVQSNRAGH